MLEYFIYLFQASTWCFCGNTLDPIHYPKKPEKDCKMPCIGNTQQMCGGGGRNSIYYQNGNSNKYIYIIHHLPTHTKKHSAFDTLRKCISSNDVLVTGKLFTKPTYKEY